MMRRSAHILGFALVADKGVGQVDPFAFLPDGARDGLSRAYPDLEERKAALSVARNAEEWRTAANPDLAGQLAEKLPVADWLA